MREIMDFIYNALPWLAIGVFVATSFAGYDAKKNNKPTRKAFNAISICPAVIFILLGVSECLEGDTGSGTTWFCLACFTSVLNYLNSTDRKTGNKQ